jgi:hypothetical protein
LTPADFSAWVAKMKAERRWSARRCARELGCAINSISTWSDRGAPAYVGLACAALAYGLPVWSPGPMKAKDW